MYVAKEWGNLSNDPLYSYLAQIAELIFQTNVAPNDGKKVSLDNFLLKWEPVKKKKSKPPEPEPREEEPKELDAVSSMASKHIWLGWLGVDKNV